MVAIFTLLIISLILISGLTDARNAVSNCIYTRSMTKDNALKLCAVCNFLGGTLFSAVNQRVAKTVFSTVDFEKNQTFALPSLCAGMCAVVVFSLFALKIGFPTSETHALISGITGAAVASNMNLSPVNFYGWLLVILGFFLSAIPPFFISKLIHFFMSALFCKTDRRKVIKHFAKTQRWSAISGSFIHGAQNSQKFMGIFMLGATLLHGDKMKNHFVLPLPLVVICSLVMALGTLLGSGRIIKRVGLDMVSLDASKGKAADMASFFTVTLCTFLGIPISTTYSKICAMLGVSYESKDSGAKKKVILQMLLSWILTFPVCAIMGFVFSLIFTSQR